MKLGKRAVKYLIVSMALTGGASTCLAAQGQESVLLSESRFDKDNKGWDIVNGEWKVQNGELIKDGEEVVATTFIGKEGWRDYTTEFDMTPLDFGQGGISFWFRAKDTKNSYLLYITPSAIKLQSKNYNAQDGGARDIVTYPVKTNINQKYHFKVRLAQDQIAVYMDDMNKPIIIANASTNGTGKLGFQTWKSKAKFDNVVVNWVKGIEPLDLEASMEKPQEGSLEAKLMIIQNKYKELGAMLQKYNNKEMKPREIIATHETAQIFTEIIKKDNGMGYPNLAIREADQAIEILDDAINKMKKGDFYLSKELSVKGAKEKDGFFVNNKGEYIFPRTMNFFEGNLADLDTKEGIDRLHNIGFNMIGGVFCQMGNVIDQNYNAKPYKDRLMKNIVIANENNLLVNALWMCDIMPDWLKKKHPEFVLPGANRTINFDVNNPELRKCQDAYVKAVMDGIFNEVGKDVVDDTFLMMNMANEPRLQHMSVNNFKEFQEILKKSYGNIGKLNKAWNTKTIMKKEYRDFAQITDYNELKLLTSNNSRALLDYNRYNNERQSDYYSWFCDTVSKHSRGVYFNQYVKFDYSRDVLNQNEHIIRSRIELDGINEGVNTFGPDMSMTDRVNEKYNVEWIKQNFALDYMRSIDKNKVSTNPEWHSANTGAITESPMAKGYMSQAVRMATYHGMAASIMWAYIEPDDEYCANSGGVISTQPRAFDEYVRESISVENELDRVSKFPTVDRKIYVLYSEDSIINEGQKYLDMVANAYEGMYFNDLSVGIINEKMLLDNNIGDMELLIIPGGEHISNSAFNKIQQLASKQTPIAVYGQALNYDEYGNKRNSAKLTGKVKYMHKGTAKSIDKDMKELMKWAGVNIDFKLINQGGNHPDYIEARFAKQGNTDIGYAINYGNKPQTFTIQNVAKGSNNSFRILENNKLGNSVTKVTLQPREHITFNMD